MAEYKNGFNYRGNMSVETEDYTPDVQTGRAVFVDEDKYTNDASYKAKVDKCVAEGFHWISEGDTPSGGGVGTALIIREERTELTEDVPTIYYDKTYQEVKDAYDAGLPIYLELHEVGGCSRLPLSRITDPDSEYYIVTVINFETSDRVTLESKSADGQLYQTDSK